MQRNSIRKYKGAAIFRCPLIATALFHALCGAQRSSASLPTDGAERALDFSRTMRYNSGTRTPRSRYHIIEKTGKMPTKYKGITPNTTFVKFHRTLFYPSPRSGRPFESHFPIKKRHHPVGWCRFLAVFHTLDARKSKCHGQPHC